MKELIRKVLKEAKLVDDAPEWVKKFNTLSREDRIDFIENKKKEIEKLLPTIIGFFKDKFGGDLVKIKEFEKPVHYGHEYYSTTIIVLMFYFSSDVDLSVKMEVRRDLKSFFNIDVEYYGVPLRLEFYIQRWEGF